MKTIWEKFLQLFGEIKYRFFGKKKSTDKIIEPITNTGLEMSRIDLINKIQETIYKDSFPIEGINCDFYYTNGYWYKSVGKNKFIYLGKDELFEGEQNFKA